MLDVGTAQSSELLQVRAPKALNLAAARLRHIAGTASSTKRYLNIELLKGPADEKCHHRVSPSRVPLSQIESAKDSGRYPALLAGAPPWLAFTLGW